MHKPFLTILLLVLVSGTYSCQREAAKVQVEQKTGVKTPTPTPTIPPTLSEIEDEKDTKTNSALSDFDFKNFTYPLPRGWQDMDSKEIDLRNGVRKMTSEKIGMNYVTTKFGDATGDGKDEAFVVLRVGTGGSASPHIVYVFDEDTDSNPNLVWYFRTGDRADGGLKRVYADDGNLVIELFGQDRYIFNQMETLKIVGDEPQLCCPTHFTKNIYKKVTNGFQLDGDRMTYSLENPKEEPQANLGAKRLEESRGKK